MGVEKMVVDKEFHRRVAQEILELLHLLQQLHQVLQGRDVLVVTTVHMTHLCCGTKHKRHKATEDEDSSNFTHMLQAIFAIRKGEREDCRAKRELEREEQKEQNEQREQEWRERQEQRELEREERHRQFDLQMQQLQQQAQFQNMLFMHMFGNNNSGSNRDNIPTFTSLLIFKPILNSGK